LYRISSVLTESSEFYSAINSLLPYSSLVVNTKFNTGDVDGDYNPGDLVVKNNDGTYTKIKAERGGIFYPAKIIQAKSLGEDNSNYTYTISYSYRSAAPDSDSTKNSTSTTNADGNKEFVCDYAETLNYVGVTGGMVGSPYNLVYTPESGGKLSSIIVDNLTAATKNTKAIAPVIKCFTATEDGIEEVYCDIKITLSSNKYKIEFKDVNAPNLVNQVVVK
jgi:hypothetical protein